MSLISRLRRIWSFFNKSSWTSSGPTLSRTQRRARDLMSLASLFGFCAILWWLLIALVVSNAVGAHAHDAPSSQALLKYWHWSVASEPVDGRRLVLAWLLALSATLAPIVCLRKLGHALYTQAPLSALVAQRFLWLGRALVANIILGVVAASIASSQIKQYEVSFSLGFWGTLIAAILAYVVADVIREGARAAEENREFV